MSLRADLMGRDRLGAQVETVKRGLRQAIADALIASAQAVAETARQRVLALRDPKRPDPSTLAESIESVPEGEGAAVNATAPYAPYVEFGTRHMPARPFLQPALEAGRESIIARAGAALRKADGAKP